MKNLIATTLIASIATLGIARAEELQAPAMISKEQTAQEEATAFLSEELQEPTAAISTEDTQAQTSLPQTDDKPYAQVGKASNDAVAAAKSKQWQNILIAVGVVAIAITALILVHNNAGH